MSASSWTKKLLYKGTICLMTRKEEDGWEFGDGSHPPKEESC